MADAPGKREPRVTEVVACGIDPIEAVNVIRAAGIGRHFYCHIHPVDDDFDEIRQTIKSLGYRATSSGEVFAHPLDLIPVIASEPAVRPVRDEETWASIRQVAGHPRRLSQGVRLYSVWDERRDYGWVKSVPVGSIGWVADLFVYREFRGRGYGRSLMSRLLQDDRAAGLQASVLIASKAGARLYPHLGYRQIGVIQMFCPSRRPLP